jgi:hypothetical protein
MSAKQPEPSQPLPPCPLLPGLRPSDKPCSTWPQRCAEWIKAQNLLKPAQ